MVVLGDYEDFCKVPPTNRHQRCTESGLLGIRELMRSCIKIENEEASILPCGNFVSSRRYSFSASK